VPEVAVGVAVATASVVEATSVAAGGSTLMVDGAGQADSTTELAVTSVEEGAATAPPVAAPDPAAAAEISAAVASSTRRFWVKMHPSGSSVVSHVLPLPVLSAS
jgi:hypothetical protein